MNQRQTILIVDDEPFNIAVLEQELDDLDYDTVSADNGQVALEQIAAKPPDLVLLDVMMPVMDGFTVLARLKAAPETRDIPVIIISAINDMPSVVKGIKQGAEDYLPKPFDPVLLQARISACLEKKRLRDQEVEYLRQVERLTHAAAAIETNTFEQSSLGSVAARPDALGGLARVFGRMAHEVHLREQRLRQQLEQVRRDMEERNQASQETAAIYVPMDRRQALARGATLPKHAHGAALSADISGFTPLTELLAQQFGLQRGAEEITRQLNQIYTILVDEVHRYGGSVINFSGDAIICWFDDINQEPTSMFSGGLRAIACGLAMQAAMQQLPPIVTPDQTHITCMLKVAIVAGPVRRLLVGDPQLHHIDTLVGQTIDTLEVGARLAQRGDVLVHAALLETTGTQIQSIGWRVNEVDNQQFALVTALNERVPFTPWPDLQATPLTNEQVRPWLLPPVYERVRDGKSAFLSELRPVVALFLSFEGIDYENDQHAGNKLDAFVRWLQTILANHGGTLLQLTIGDKGSYTYAAFGAPIAHENDPARAVFAALDLLNAPASLSWVTQIQIGLTYGYMHAGAYGSATQRTYGVLGDHTNLAARLMQAAHSTILCDEAIYQATQGSVVFEMLPPILVKGKTQPVVVYRPLAKTTESMIGSRIDQLALAYQLTLKVASVIGPVFTRDALQAIYPSDAEKLQLDSHLQQLELSRFLARQPNQTTQELSYVFCDLATHTTVYNRLLFAQRRQLHRAVAEWYERLEPDTLALHAAVVAQHWSKAENSAKAIEYMERAGYYARQQGDNKTALMYFDNILKLNT